MLKDGLDRHKTNDDTGFSDPQAGLRLRAVRLEAARHSAKTEPCTLFPARVNNFRVQGSKGSL